MATTRREFIKLAVGGVAVEELPMLAMETGQAEPLTTNNLEYRSAFLRIQMAPNQPNFVILDVDSLGKNKLGGNLMLPLKTAGRQYKASREGDIWTYKLDGKEDGPEWTFVFSDSGFAIRSSNNVTEPLILGFGCHATLLGLIDDLGDVRLPALLHFPAHGTLRITTKTHDAVLGYDAVRGGDNLVYVTLPATGREYRFEATAIYPDFAGANENPQYDGYRRDFLSMFQMNPRRRALANNSASDTCAFTVFEYSMMAIPLQPLAEGLSALDLIRQTLERYIGAMKGYGMVGYQPVTVDRYDFLDTYPSLVMAASDYIQTSQDKTWLKRNYSVIRTWADKMIEFDRDGDGIMEYPVSGNSGSWSEDLTVRPSNWWDTIGFGHKDAYSNALAYKAFDGMAELAIEAGYPHDAEIYKGRAGKLKAIYYNTFYNPETGVLAGWKSADDKLHDYYFLFVNGIAVTCGLVTSEQGNDIWDKLLAKMKEVGYHRFDLGLPGNLIPVHREDYPVHEKRWGGSQKADGSDGFQIYENGGASACFAYYTIRALQILGRDKDADAILYPMLKGFAEGGFQGRGPDGKTYDWTDWKGGPNGYEGLLVDNYLALLAAMPAH
jgi:hypothetical protein